ncbi:HPr family phosphocarrier protein [Paenibacillus alkaliterrae]|uniref:HPr family phosphocarrier protein n=1 Tax=Paenibacillus alkaliterrae TaxID=320909 RepID=UPI001F260D15|nr:HPr family phosphocarrier protein [Paenibacillus alkaliterrae]MCF2938500.1 HPr family phosphocarrier protein [Paenibacillus alkaliterrae]
MQNSYVIQNPFGIHARPARKIVEAAKASKESVTLVKDGKSFNAKSLVHVISVGAKFGDSITVNADGEQAEDVIAAIGAILTAVEQHAEKEQ